MTPGTNKWHERHVLVTGCSGFVGRWLVSGLRGQGATVIGHGRRGCEGVESVQGSLSDRKLIERTIREFKVDTVFHLAAQPKVEIGRENPAETFEVNAQGTWNVLEAVRSVDTNIRVLLASTDMVYEASGKLPYVEDGPTDAVSPYAASKLCAELIARSYQRSFGVRVCVARTSNLYGGGDLSFERIIPGTIRAAIRGEAPVIHSDGRPERDYLYIEDAIAGYLLLAEAMEDESIAGETFNFSTGVPVSVAGVVDAILKMMERTDLKPKVLGGGSGGSSIRYASPAKARQKLGWHAGTSLEEGLKKTISWYQAHESRVRVEAQN